MMCRQAWGSRILQYMLVRSTLNIHNGHGINLVPLVTIAVRAVRCTRRGVRESASLIGIAFKRSAHLRAVLGWRKHEADARSRVG